MHISNEIENNHNKFRFYPRIIMKTGSFMPSADYTISANFPIVIETISTSKIISTFPYSYQDFQHIIIYQHISTLKLSAHLPIAIGIISISAHQINISTLDYRSQTRVRLLWIMFLILKIKAMWK